MKYKTTPPLSSQSSVEHVLLLSSLLAVVDEDPRPVIAERDARSPSEGRSIQANVGVEFKGVSWR
eukprot:31460-Pelagococcus_subviridis.AAC.4